MSKSDKTSVMNEIEKKESAQYDKEYNQTTSDNKSTDQVVVLKEDSSISDGN